MAAIYFTFLIIFFVAEHHTDLVHKLVNQLFLGYSAYNLALFEDYTLALCAGAAYIGLSRFSRTVYDTAITAIFISAVISLVRCSTCFAIEIRSIPFCRRWGDYPHTAAYAYCFKYILCGIYFFYRVGCQRYSYRIPDTVKEQ